MAKGEGLYPAPTHKRIEELDAEIANLGKSTRASIPALIPLHDVMRQRFRWYYRWSAFKPSKYINLVILVLYLAGAGFIISNLFTFPREAMAKVRTIPASELGKPTKEQAAALNAKLTKGLKIKGSGQKFQVETDYYKASFDGTQTTLEVNNHFIKTTLINTPLIPKEEEPEAPPAETPTETPTVPEAAPTESPPAETPTETPPAETPSETPATPTETPSEPTTFGIPKALAQETTTEQPATETTTEGTPAETTQPEGTPTTEQPTETPATTTPSTENVETPAEIAPEEQPIEEAKETTFSLDRSGKLKIADAAAEVDSNFSAMNGMLKDSIVIKSPQVSKIVYNYEIDSETTLIKQPDGSIGAGNINTFEPYYSISAPQVTDANGKKIAFEYQLTAKQIILKPKNFSAFQAAAFPLMVDPSYVVQSSAVAGSTSSPNQRKIARTSTGRLWTVYIRSDGSYNNVYAAYSDDEGVNWNEYESPVSNPDSNNTQSSPAIAIDSDDTIHVVWQGLGFSDCAVGKNAIRYRYRTTSGWEADSENVYCNASYDYANPSIAVDHSDNVFVAWNQTTSPNVNLKKRSSGSWGSLETINDSGGCTGTNQMVDIAADSTGQINAVWQGVGCNTYTKSNITFRQRNVWGTWGTRENVTTGSTYDQQRPSIAVDSSDQVRILWSGPPGWTAGSTNTTIYNIQYRLRTGASTYGSRELVTDDADAQGVTAGCGFLCIGLSIAMDTADNVHTTWVGLGWGTNTTKNSVQYRERTSSWQSQVDVINRAYDQFGPVLIWAKNPADKTNIPGVGYAFLWNGQDASGWHVEYYKSSDLDWGPLASSLYSNNTTAQSGSTNPTDLTDLTPAFSAVYNDTAGGTANKAQIQVSLDPTFASVTHWDSGSSGNAISNCSVGSRCQDIVYGSFGTAPTLDLEFDSGLAIYYWRIRYWDSGGASGGWSSVRESASFTLLGLPNKPLNVLTTPTTDGFTVNWSDDSDDEEGFEVYISTDANATTDCSAATYPGSPDYTAAANATSQAVIGKSLNTFYCAKVIAYNDAGDSDAGYSAGAKEVDVTTTDHAMGLWGSYPRYLVKTSSGDLVLFYKAHDASGHWNILVTRSPDNGLNWYKWDGVTPGADVMLDTGSDIISYGTFDAKAYHQQIDNKDHIYFVYEQANGLIGDVDHYIYYKNLTFDGSLAVAPTQVKKVTGAFNTATDLDNPTINMVESAPNRLIWVSYLLYNDTGGTIDSCPTGTMCQMGAYALNDLWGVLSLYKVAETFMTDGSIVSQGSNIWIINSDITVDVCKLYYAGWSTASSDWTNPSSTAITTVGCGGAEYGTMEEFSVATIGSNVHIIFRDPTVGIRHIWYNAGTSSWVGPTTISSSGNDKYPQAVTNGTDLFAIASIYNGANDYTIKFKKYTVGTATWGNWVTYSTTSGNNLYSNGLLTGISDVSSDNIFSSAWLTGTADPYTIHTKAPDPTTGGGKYTLANVPGAPTLDDGNAKVNVVINQNSNPTGPFPADDTDYAIYNVTLSKYVGADGVADEASEVWQTYSAWGGASGIDNTGLTNGTEYCYKVKARNGDNTATALSDQACATPEAPHIPIVTTLEPTDVDENSALAHGEITDAGGSVVITRGFKYYQSANCTDENGENDKSENGGYGEGEYSLTIDGLSPNTQYSHKAYAINGIGTGYGDCVASTYIWTWPDPVTVAVASGDWDLDSNYHMDISWMGNASTVRVHRQTPTELDVCITADTSCIDSNLLANTEYTYRIYSRNGNTPPGENPDYAPASDWTPPNAPATCSHTGNETDSVTWTWDAVTEATSYILTDAALTPIQSGIAAPPYEDSGLLTNAQYTRKVRATNANGSGAPTPAACQAYTSIETPTGITFGAINTDSIALSASGTLSNLTSNLSGLYFDETTANPGGNGIGDGFETWTQTNSVTDAGLSLNTQYCYNAKARNGDSDETVATADSCKYTGANPPSAPTITALSWTEANGNGISVNVDPNANPGGTEFAIACNTAGNSWLDASDGSCDSAADPPDTTDYWKTESAWEIGEIGYLKNLLADTNFTIITRGRNGDKTNTANSGESNTVMTAPAQPTGLVHTANTTTTITWDWNDNAVAPDGYHLMNASDETIETAAGASTVVQNQSDAVGTPLTANTAYQVKTRGYRAAITGQPTALSTGYYTSIEDPTGVTFGTIAIDSIQLSATGSFSNLTSDSSGLCFTETTSHSGGGEAGICWKQNNNVIDDAGLATNVQYSYTAQSRNGDGDLAAQVAGSKYTLADDAGTPAAFGEYTEANSYYEDVVLEANTNPDVGDLQNAAGTAYKTFYDTDAGGGFVNVAQDWTYHSDLDTITHTNLPGGLTCNQTYYYKQLARNGDSVESALSAAGWDTTPPCAPTNPNETDLTSSGATFNWDGVAGPVPTYTVSYGTDVAATNLGETAGVTDAFLTVGGLNASTNYYFKVKATNVNGTGAWSAIDDLATPVGIDQLMIRLPGQTFTSGTGITGTPDYQVAGRAFGGLVVAVDENKALIDYSTNLNFTTPTDDFIPTYNQTYPYPAPPMSMTGGQATVSQFKFFKAGLYHYINVFGSSGTSSQFVVRPGPLSPILSSGIPASQTVEAGQTASIVVQLKDIYTNNIPYHNVTVTSDRLGDVISYSAAETSFPDGRMTIYVSSAIPGTSTLTITDSTAAPDAPCSGSCTLVDKPQITFTAPAPSCASAIYGEAGNAETIVYWTNPTSAFFDHVSLYRSTVSGALGSEIYSGTGTSFNDTGLTNETTYYYTVKAFDIFGNACTSSQIDLTPTGEIDDQPPSAPGNLRATNIGCYTLALAWDASTDDRGVEGYRLYNLDTGVLIGTTSQTIYNLAALSPGTTYRFYAVAFDEAGNVSNHSNILTVTTNDNCEACVGPGCEPPPPCVGPNCIVCRESGGQAVFLVLGNTPAEIASGQEFPDKVQVKVFATDGGGAICDKYNGSVYFYSSDPKAKLTWNQKNSYPFTLFDSGMHEFDGKGFVLYTPGEQTLTVTDGQAKSTVVINVIGGQVFVKFQEKTKDVVTHNANNINTGIILLTALLLLVPLLINLLISLANLWPQLMYWFLQFLQLIGLRKKREPWGVVFNSQTGQPISLAVVRIYEKEYNRLLESTVTDQEGRYGFLTKPGVFYILVRKSGFVFPSQYKVSSFYENIYTGGNFEIKEKDEAVSLNIPLDPEVKATIGWRLLVAFIKFMKFLQKLRLPLLAIGFLVSLILTITSYHIIYLLSVILYLLIFILEILRSRKARPYGLVTDVFEHPLDTAIVRIFENRTGKLVSTDVSDGEGRFRFLVNPGIYYLTAVKPGYTDFKSHIMYLEKEKTQVSSNIKLKKIEGAKK